MSNTIDNKSELLSEAAATFKAILQNEDISIYSGAIQSGGPSYPNFVDWERRAGTLLQRIDAHLSTPHVQTECEKFEAKVYLEYFIRAVHFGDLAQFATVDPDLKIKSELFKRDATGDYTDSHISAMWKAWQWRADS